MADDLTAAVGRWDRAHALAPIATEGQRDLVAAGCGLRAALEQAQQEIIQRGQACAVWITGDLDDGYALTTIDAAWEAIDEAHRLGQERNNQWHEAQQEIARLTEANAALSGGQDAGRAEYLAWNVCAALEQAQGKAAAWDRIQAYRATAERLLGAAPESYLGWNWVGALVGALEQAQQENERLRERCDVLEPGARNYNPQRIRADKAEALARRLAQALAESQYDHPMLAAPAVQALLKD